MVPPRILHHILYSLGAFSLPQSLYIIWSTELFCSHSFIGMKGHERFFMLSLLNRSHRMWEGGNNVLFSLNINLQCSTKLPLLRAAIPEERSASFTLWPEQWYGLSNSLDSANPHLLSALPTPVPSALCSQTDSWRSIIRNISNLTPFDYPTEPSIKVEENTPSLAFPQWLMLPWKWIRCFFPCCD